MKKFLFTLIISFILIPAIAEAAVLYLEPAEGEYYQEDTFIVTAKINTEECINTVEGNLNFSQDILEVVDFSQGSSILTIWLKKPEILQNSGLISFTGGIPGGYCGRLPGDPGESNLLGKIIFKVKTEKPEIAKVKFLDTSQVLLNDGFGTPAKLNTREAVFTILSGISETPKEEWLQELEKDTILPQPFEIEISQDPSIFDGKYFIIFSTNDKETGIDHYQVKEGERDWQIAESPYLLEDQGLTSIIKVKAVDKASNERIAEIIGPRYLPPEKLFPYWIIIIILAGIGIIWWIIKRILMTKSK